MLESAFQKKVKGRLDALIKEGIPLYYFVKEAGAIRGIPDIVGCVCGHFFAWELKRDGSEAGKTTGRIALQRYTLLRIHKAQGHGQIVHPANLEDAIQELLKLSAQQHNSSATSDGLTEIIPE